MTEDPEKQFIKRREKLGRALLKTTKAFLEQEGGLRYMDLRICFETALKWMIVAKTQGKICSSPDPSSAGQ